MYKSDNLKNLQNSQYKAVQKMLDAKSLEYVELNKLVEKAKEDLVSVKLDIATRGSAIRSAEMGKDKYLADFRLQEEKLKKSIEKKEKKLDEFDKKQVEIENKHKDSIASLKEDIKIASVILKSFERDLKSLGNEISVKELTLANVVEGLYESNKLLDESKKELQQIKLDKKEEEKRLDAKLVEVSLREKEDRRIHGILVRHARRLKRKYAEHKEDIIINI